MIVRILPAAALLASLSAAAWAQTTPPAAPAPSPAPAPQAAPAPQPAPAPPPPMSKATAAQVEKRIASLQTALGITPAEMPLWNAFAQSIRNSAAATEALFERRAQAAPTMTAVDNMRSYAGIARAYADTMDRLAADFASLYAGLTDVQRHAADTMFRGQTPGAPAK